ncbi:MAG: hypothetical protein IJF05_05195 [Clostridia bacterium]|nr:hypothetical protein [Clostridia bacterium]
MTEMQKKLAKFRRKNKNATQKQRESFVAAFNWTAITEQDDAVWEKIFNFLEDRELV